MKNGKASLAFIFITLLLDIIGIGIIIPVIPALIEDLTGQGTSEASQIGGLLMASFVIMQFVFAPLMGELSDRYGRRPVLLISMFMMGIDYLVHAFSPTLAWLFVGRILAGITGASHTVATAYVADVSTKENKAKNFGMIGAAFGLGFIIGPLIGGFFAQWGPRAPFIAAAVITFANFIFGLLILPESLPAEKRRKVQLKNAIPGVSLFALRKYAGLAGIILAFFFANLAGQSLPATWTYFTKEAYGWNEAEVGYSLAAVGVMVSIVQAVLLGKVVKKFGNKLTIMGGFLLWALGMSLFAVAVEGWMLYLFLIPYALGGVAGPTLQSLASNEVPDNEQGNLQGGLTSMVSITFIIGALIYTNVFTLFTKQDGPAYFPSAPYVVAAFFLIIGCFIAYRALNRMEFEPRERS